LTIEQDSHEKERSKQRSESVSASRVKLKKSFDGEDDDGIRCQNGRK